MTRKKLTLVGVSLLCMPNAKSSISRVESDSLDDAIELLIEYDNDRLCCFYTVGLDEEGRDDELDGFFCGAKVIE